MSLPPLTEGWTSAFEITLTRNGTRAVFLSSQHTPSGVLKSRGFGAKDMTGNIAWYASCGVTYASCGAIAVTFDSSDLVASESPYLFRVRITSGASSSDVAFFPNGAAEPLEVYAP